MLDIKIVEFKWIKGKKEPFYTRSFLEEDTSYTIEEFTDKYRAKFSKDKKFRKKIDFLKAVSINNILIGEIFKFRAKFKIDKDIPYTKYYFHDDEIPHIKSFNLEKEIPKEQEEYINKIYKKFYINPFLYNIFIDLLYTQKVNLDDIVLDDIKISVYDGFNIPNGLTIEILSKTVTKTYLTDYIDKNWNKQIKPLMKRLPDEKDLITVSTSDVKLYNLRNTFIKKVKRVPTSIFYKLKETDERLTNPKTKIERMPYSEIYMREDFSERFKSHNTLRTYYNSLLKKVSKIFKKKS